MIGSTTSHENDTKDDETDNGDDLQTRKPKFHFYKYPCTQEVDGKNEDQEDRHVDSWMGDGI